MARGTFNFFYQSKIRGIPGSGVIILTAMNYVSEYLNQVVRHPSCKFGSVNSFGNPLGSAVQPDDLLVYIVPGPSKLQDSVVALKGGEPGNLSHGGMTALVGGNTTIVSEVYWARATQSRDPARLLANCVFHEFMHNKLDMIQPRSATLDMHDYDGTGLAIARTTEAGRPSKRNIENFAPALSKRVPQFTEYLRPPPSTMGLEGRWWLTIHMKNLWRALMVFDSNGTVYWANSPTDQRHYGKWRQDEYAIVWKFDDDDPKYKRTFFTANVERPTSRGKVQYPHTLVPFTMVSAD